MAVCVMHLPAVVIGDDGLPFVGCVACPHAYPWDEAPADLVADCIGLMFGVASQPVALVDRQHVPHP